MRLATIARSDGPAVGVVRDDGIVDLVAALPGAPRSVAEILGGGPEALIGIEEACRNHEPEPVENVSLLAPVPRPGKFLAVGLNYAAHAEETGRRPPEFPTVFNKQVTCVNRPGGEIHVPGASSAVDYEGELAIVIGRGGRAIPRQAAAAAIGGYTIVNDVSVRDWQRRSPTMILGKGWDTHGPMGPWVVTSDALVDPHGLRLRTWVDDELRQEASTGDLVFDCWQLVEILSTVCTLEPGDVIATGTPAGVGVAFDPPRFLRPGSRVRIEIEGIGVLENPVVAEP